MEDVLERLRTALEGRYQVREEVGKGGMALVFLAEDLKHHRNVALKVLRAELAAVLGAERFLKEIEVTAQLQHPNILPLYDSGEADGFLYYVMPLMEGESLREVLDREGELPVDQAVEIARAVAAALDYAHGRGVIHRDIKPSNILLQGGQALVADFGIALAMRKAGGDERLTETGLSLGTPHYMSPEQAAGDRELDRRSDIYSLGATLYEMLVGEPPHMGKTPQSVVAKILSETPAPIRKTREMVPPNVEAAVAKALARSPADRFKTAAELAAALVNPSFQLATTVLWPSTEAEDRPGPGFAGHFANPYFLVPSVLAVVASAIALILATTREVPTPLPNIRYVLAAPDSSRPTSSAPWPAAISPEGGTVVYSVHRGDGTSMLYSIRTDELDARPIPGTDNAHMPYFSPDGQWLAFEMDAKAYKVRLDGGLPLIITEAYGSNGADWTVRDEIVLGAQGPFKGLSHVSAAGGEAVGLTLPDSTQGERDHLWPIAFPDGETVAFVIWYGSLESSQLAVTSLGDGVVHPLGLSGIRPLAVVDGHLVYVQADGAVMAIRMTDGGKVIRGNPIPVHNRVPVEAGLNGNSWVFVSSGGALVTARGGARGGARGRLAWMELDGAVETVTSEDRPLMSPQLSPDGSRAAALVGAVGSADIWIYDFALGTFSRLTSMGQVTSLEWTPDGSRLLFTGGTEGTVWTQASSGGEPAQLLYQQASLLPQATLSPDGRTLLATTLSGENHSLDLIRVDLDSTAITRDFLDTPANEASPAFSPDGRWVALESEESGRREVYVRSFPDPSMKVQVSTNGGTDPSWSKDGRRLFYLAGSALMAASVSLEPSFQLLGRDTLLAQAPQSLLTGGNWTRPYDVSQDGRRVLAVVRESDDFQIVVSPNWITEFRRIVGASETHD
jgi:serine/threonine protein kinase/Tol biopolymer transport system component